MNGLHGTDSLTLVGNRKAKSEKVTVPVATPITDDYRSDGRTSFLARHAIGQPERLVCDNSGPI